MYSKTRVRRNNTSLASSPGLMESISNLFDIIPSDNDLRNLWKTRVKDTPFNRELSFWCEPVVISFAYITAYTILGDGPKINCTDEDAKQISYEWFNKINYARETIDDLFVDSYVDNVIHGRSIWRNMFFEDAEHKIDTARLDPKSLTKKKNSVQGYEVYIQRARKERKTFYSQSSYYNYWKNMRYSTQDSLFHENPQTSQLDKDKYEYIIIPNESEYLLELDFFRRPPISSVLNHMVYKRWILWYMKQYAERYWSPFKVGFVGDPKSYMPDTPEVFKRERDVLFTALMKMKNFGVMATAGYNRIEEFGQGTAKSSGIFVDFANFMNEELMFALMGSMGIRSARGTELATGRVLEQGFLRYATGIRGRYARDIANHLVTQVLPANGVEISGRDLELRFSPIILESVDKVVSSVRDACECMIFEDWNEPRKILQSVFGNVMDELPKEKAKSLQEKFMKMNEKQQNDGGQAFAKNKENNGK